MEQVRVSPRRRRQGVHIEEERIKPIYLPNVITRNESGQEMETSIVIYPGSMPSTGKSSVSTQETESQSKPVEARIITEAKILEVANSNIFHDGAFLEFLKTSKAKVKGDTQDYLRSLKIEILFFTVRERKVNGANTKEIVMVTKDNRLWHLDFKTLRNLKYTEVSTVLELIESDGKINECLALDLKKDQFSRLPEVCTNPWTVIYQDSPNKITQLVMSRDLNHHNKRKIHFVLEQLKKKVIRSAEEIEVISILQSFIATGTIPESVKHRRNKDDDDQDGDKSGDIRYPKKKEG